MKFHFICGGREEDREFCTAPELVTKQVAPEQAEVIICFGGDGLLIDAIRKYRHLPVKFYGVSRKNSVGFLMNRIEKPSLILERLKRTYELPVPILTANLHLQGEQVQKIGAINELLVANRENRMVKLELKISGETRLKTLKCDGLIIATPLGSPAHNYSAGGSILPLNSRLLSLKALAPFAPRCWGGALVEDDSVLEILAEDEQYRPALVSADGGIFQRFARLVVKLDRINPVRLLFNDTLTLQSQIWRQQFP